MPCSFGGGDTGVAAAGLGEGGIVLLLPALDSGSSMIPAVSVVWAPVVLVMSGIGKLFGLASSRDGAAMVVALSDDAVAVVAVVSRT